MSWIKSEDLIAAMEDREYWGIVSAGIGLWSLCFHLKLKDDNGE